MQVQDERSQDEFIQALQQQVDELTAENLLLKEQLARKEQFTAMIAHELRGPLAPIINYAQMLARQANGAQAEKETEEKKQRRAASVQRQTSIIVSQARRMTRLVNDLLDASRLTSG